jgi:hypothetical protein
MKVNKWVPLLVFCLFLGGIFPILGYPSDPDDANRQALSDLLKELDQKIEDADKRMVAHPKFLDELRALVDKFRSKLREVFLKEDFSDGDYTKNPKWVVDSGRFKLTPSRRLWSQVSAERPAATPASKEKPDPLGVLLKEVIRSATEDEGKKAPTAATKEASIHTLARLGPAFEVDFTLVSESQWGSMEVVLLGGKPAIPRYRMVYHAAPSADRPIQIVRERGSRSYIIESATRYPALDEGTPHRVQWIRDVQGQMRVLVDGKEVLSTVEVFYKNDFAGLALVNRGGTYEWGTIRILQASQE